MTEPLRLVHHAHNARTARQTRTPLAPLVRAFGAAAAVAAIAIGVGCSFALYEGGSYVGPKNVCTTTCADGGECLDGRCTKRETSYPYVVEVTPPTAAYYAPNVTFAFKAASGDIVLPLAAHVVVTSNPAIALAIKLSRIGAIPGEAGVSYSARAGNDGHAQIDVPPGDYALSVAPASDNDRRLYPPIEYGTFKIDSSEHFHVDYSAKFPSLVVDLTDSSGKPVPAGQRNDGREISIVDGTTGRIVSTVDRTCDECPECSPPIPLHLNRAELKFARPIVGHIYRLRIAPPAIACDKDPPLRPTYDLDLAGLSVEGDNPTRTVKIPLDPTPVFPVEVTVRGASLFAGDRPPVTAALLFRSTQVVLKDDFTPAFFSVSGTSPQLSGRFILPPILPGTYTVELVPDVADETARRYAVRAQDGVKIASPQTPLLFELLPKTRVTGRALALDGTSSLFTLGDVEASVAAAAGPPDSKTTMQPRSAAATVSVTQDKPNDPSSEHNLTIPLDPGRFDLVVRVPEASGYPWIVRSLVDVPGQAAFDLGALWVTSPVTLRGRVVAPNGEPVPRATIRVRALVCPTAKTPKDCTAPAEAVLVAETRANELGDYTLMLPSAIEIGQPTK